MFDYLYDGTFEGFLTSVYENYYCEKNEKAAGIYFQHNYEPNLIYQTRFFASDTKKSEKVYKAIRKNISNDSLLRVYRTFLSGNINKDCIIFEYLKMAFKVGYKIDFAHKDDRVIAIQKIENQVVFETHRLLGLLRFSVLTPYNNESILLLSAKNNQEILYAEVEPDNDVIELLADHFSDRYKYENYIIHDKKRNKAVFSNQGRWYIAEFNEDLLNSTLTKSLDEDKYQTLWKQYFTSIAIKERTNPRCQKNFMPVRYWKNLTEMK